jgi:hypothetical protein
MSYDDSDRLPPDLTEAQIHEIAEGYRNSRNINLWAHILVLFGFGLSFLSCALVFSIAFYKFSLLSSAGLMGGLLLNGFFVWGFLRIRIPSYSEFMAGVLPDREVVKVIEAEHQINKRFMKIAWLLQIAIPAVILLPLLISQEFGITLLFSTLAIFFLWLSVFAIYSQIQIKLLKQKVSSTHH